MPSKRSLTRSNRNTRNVDSFSWTSTDVRRQSCMGLDEYTFSVLTSKTDPYNNYGIIRSNSKNLTALCSYIRAK